MHKKIGNKRLRSQQSRHARVRRKISGTAERPRLCIHKSLKHIYAQVVDDVNGRTIVAVTTNTNENKKDNKSFRNRQWAEKLGKEIGKQASDKGVQAVVFDRGGYQYHGVVKSFADGAREAGLKF